MLAFLKLENKTQKGRSIVVSVGFPYKCGGFDTVAVFNSAFSKKVILDS